MENNKIELHDAIHHIDFRGVLTYFKELNLSAVKRMYIIEHPDLSTVRAWQGHKVENKWFFVINGAFKILTVKPDNWSTPSRDLTPTEHLLTATDTRVLQLPGGYATGITALTPNSRLLIFSNFTTHESKKDDFRFEKDLWYKW